MKSAMLRSLGRGALPILTLVGVSACNSADMPTNVLFSCDEYAVYADSVTHGAYTVRAISPSELLISDADTPGEPDTLRIPAPNDSLPRFVSDHLLIDALYNKALSEIDPIHDPLALACIDPELAMSSLRDRIKDDCIAADPDIIWPVSSGRAAWVIEAYEVYKVTGDRRWLEEVYRVTRNTLAEDFRLFWNPHFRLMQGAPEYYDSTDLYPAWMHQADIYSSMSLATNAIYARAYGIMGEICGILGHDDANQYTEMAEAIATAVNNNLWIPNLGYYSEYLYGGVYPLQSQATDNIGQSLAVLFDIAKSEMARSVVSKTPVTPSGRIYPLYPAISESQTESFTSHLQPLWNMAAAKCGNMAALGAGLAALYHDAAMSCIDSSADSNRSDHTGIPAMVIHVYAGMTFTPDGIRFRPSVPKLLTGDKKITNFHYRKSDLNITISGTGTAVSRFIIDGMEQTDRIFPADSEGQHSIEIVMSDNRPMLSSIRQTEPASVPPVPTTVWRKRRNATITNFTPGTSYNVYLNGIFEEQIQTDSYSLYDAKEFTTVSFVPIADEMTFGYTMRPHEYIPDSLLTVIEAESLTRGGTRLIKDKKTARRFVELTAAKNPRLGFSFYAPDAGTYFMDLCYAAGTPVGSQCAIRSITVDGNHAGTIILPRRRVGSRSEICRSNMIRMTLPKGECRISIDYVSSPTTDRIRENVLLDYIRIIKQ